MNRITDALTASHTLSLAAMEEASREGARMADLEHLLLALVLDEGLAGQVLRAQGITLEGARTAIAEQHREQLASIGIDSEAVSGGRIAFHETSGYEWSETALRLMRRADARGSGGATVGILRELVDEPSGLIPAVLLRLGTTPERIRDGLDAHADLPAASADRAPATSRDEKSLFGRAHRFLPAPPAEVWALLADPRLIPEWDTNIASIEDHDGPLDPGETLEAESMTEAPDGRSLHVRPEFVRQTATLVASREPDLVEWRFSFPEARGANTRRIRCELEPTAGGTQLRLSIAWERSADSPRRPIRGFLLKPLHRLVMKVQLAQLGASISRCFR